MKAGTNRLSNRIVSSTTIVLAVFLLVGCNSTKSVSHTPLTTELAIERVNGRAGLVKTLKGSGNLTIESAELNATVSFELALRRPDSLLLTLEGPFGVNVGSIFIAGDRFVFYNAANNQVVEGNVEHVRLPWLAGLKLDGESITTFLTASPAIPRGGIVRRNHPSTDDEDADPVLLQCPRTDGSDEVNVDPADGVVKRYASFDSRHGLVLVQEFSQYAEADGVLMPHLLRIIMPPERRMLSLHFRKISINREPVALVWEVPDNAEHRTW